LRRGFLPQACSAKARLEEWKLSGRVSCEHGCETPASGYGCTPKVFGKAEEHAAATAMSQQIFEPYFGTAGGATGGALVEGTISTFTGVSLAGGL
jgi:hypothetical protein